MAADELPPAVRDGSARRWEYVYFPVMVGFSAFAALPWWPVLALVAYFAAFALMSAQHRWDLTRYLRVRPRTAPLRLRDQAVVAVLVLSAIPTLRYGGLAVPLSFLAACLHHGRERAAEGAIRRV